MSLFERKPHCVSLVVQKFGGTSLADIPRIRHVADLVIREAQKGSRIVAVVSAMAGTTNHFFQWCQDLGGGQGSPESDAVLATGEQITAGLLALALQKRGYRSRSWTGAQIPIITTADHGSAEILEIDCRCLHEDLATGSISIVTGFQGITRDGRITTLGRGGSDTTAVALAAWLQADRCDIYTDVDGVYLVDPRMVTDAHKAKTLSYEDMLALSDNGAKVLHPRAVRYAQKHQIPLQVLSSFSFEPGTLISLRGDSARPPFGLTYTTGWFAAQSASPFSETLHPEGREIRYDASGRKTYQYIFPESAWEDLERHSPKDLVIQRDLVSISVIGSMLDKEETASLRTGFCRALGSSALPRVYGLSTSPLKWQLWVEKKSFPGALRFLYRALQRTHDIL